MRIYNGALRMVDQIRYDLLTQQALRGVVRSVLTDTAKKGLPGDHHFYISFDTKADGVHMSDRLRAQYPEEMTIILQHQFWDLKVSEDDFEVDFLSAGCRSASRCRLTPSTASLIPQCSSVFSLRRPPRARSDPHLPTCRSP